MSKLYFYQTPSGNNHFFDLYKSLVRPSEYPSNFIPSGADAFVGYDKSIKGSDYTVKGFYDPKKKEFHIQEEGVNLKDAHGLQ